MLLGSKGTLRGDCGAPPAHLMAGRDVPWWGGARCVWTCSPRLAVCQTTDHARPVCGLCAGRALMLRELPVLRLPRPHKEQLHPRGLSERFEKPRQPLLPLGVDRQARASYARHHRSPATPLHQTHCPDLHSTDFRAPTPCARKNRQRRLQRVRALRRRAHEGPARRTMHSNAR